MKINQIFFALLTVCSAFTYGCQKNSVKSHLEQAAADQEMIRKIEEENKLNRKRTIKNPPVALGLALGKSFAQKMRDDNPNKKLLENFIAFVETEPQRAAEQELPQDFKLRYEPLPLSFVTHLTMTSMMAHLKQKREEAAQKYFDLFSGQAN